MKTFHALAAFAVFVALTASSAFAASADMAALAKKGNCMACHAIDHKVVGPAFKDVAKKYKGQKIEDKLALKVKNGGSGVWGTMPMPPNSAVTAAEAKTLVQWVLSLK